MKVRPFIPFTAAIVALAVAPACSKSEPSLDTKSTAAAGESVQRQSITVDGAGFHPSEITGKPGQKVTLAFRRTSDDTCAKQVVFKDLGIRRELPLNQDAEVTITLGNAPIGFACGMDMFRGSIVAR